MLLIPYIFIENGIDILQKNNLSDNWRDFRSDTKSQLRTDNSVPTLSIIHQLPKVKNENQGTMDYEEGIRSLFSDSFLWLIQPFLKVQCRIYRTDHRE